MRHKMSQNIAKVGCWHISQEGLSQEGGERSVPREVCPKKMVERSFKSLTLVRAPSEPAPVVEGDLPVMDEVISMKSSGSW